jgi:DNA-binding NtrC family response regulator
MPETCHRDTVRIPFHVSVEVEPPAPFGRAYSRNLSAGGICLRVLDAAPDDVALGTRLDLRFRVPSTGAMIRCAAKVVWVDPIARDHQGNRTTVVGLGFEPGQDLALARIAETVKGFCYRIAALDFPGLDLAREELSDLYPIDVMDSEEALRVAVLSGTVGLVLMGERGGAAESAARLLQLLGSIAAERHPTILFCGEEPAAAPGVEDLVARSWRVVFSRWPIERLALRSLARRAVESHALALENERLTSELEGTLERLRRENLYLRGQVLPSPRLGGLIGESASMRRVYDLVERVAPLGTTVLIQGETGTGKDLVARAIHARSPRASRPFVAQNCAAVAETLLDSELFGHVRGSFTGAVVDRPGLFEAADGGTIFLDEVGEMTASMQAKLLRVLEDGEVRRMGASRTERVDVRVICATHRDLASLVREGRFREDLFYRLRSFVIPIPSLAERREDIPPLVMHFLERYAERHARPVVGITSEAMRLLEGHPWPGNVRELEHMVERLVVMSPSGAKVLEPLVHETLGVLSAGSVEGPGDGSRSLDDAVRSYERQLIALELERANGVVAEAARALGIDRTTLSKRCKRLGIRQSGSAVSRDAPGLRAAERPVGRGR